MHQANPTNPATLRRLLPSWVHGWLTGGDPCHVASVVIPNAASLPRAQLTDAVAQAYTSLRSQIAQTHTPYPIRFWSFIPAIHEDMGDGLDRYMAFNAGRFAAYEQWFGSPDAFNQMLATASAVGVDEPHLTICCLAASRPGSPVENPRQTPAYRYSKRFGPLPPCFARATLVSRPAPTGEGPTQRVLLVGGTASVRGEESMHIGNLERQTHETLDNLAALAAAAMNHASQDHTFLRLFRHLRVYHPPNDALSALRPILARAFPQIAEPEFFPARICRRELITEIEAVVMLD